MCIYLFVFVFVDIISEYAEKSNLYKNYTKLVATDKMVTQLSAGFLHFVLLNNTFSQVGSKYNRANIMRYLIRLALSKN